MPPAAFMQLIFEILAVIFFFGAMIVCPVAFLGMLYFLFRTTSSTVLGRAVWKSPPGIRGIFYNPFNQILDTKMLTEDGRRYRIRLVMCVMFFITPILLSFLFAGLAGWPMHAR